ncbi:putative uncharacterized protein [Bacteroides sp. CAG:462]|nr:putative uncharacterized protein [Bacteroides sp. CAG:462]
MKKISYLVCLLACAAFCACEKEDALEAGKVDFSDPYVIADNPKDPIQHRRYEIYKKYGVPVFFNDTVQSEYIGEDAYGKPIYQYETLDLNWNFSTHTGGDIVYHYTYLTDPAAQDSALNFAETYLSIASKKMQPFAMLLTRKTRTNTSTPKDTINYLYNFRLLLLSNMEDMNKLTKETMVARSRKMINEMVLVRVQNYEKVAARFGSVSSTNNYYCRPWKELGTTSQYTTNSLLHTKNIYDAKWMDRYGRWVYPEATDGELDTIRMNIIDDIGQFGFICGDENTPFQDSPTSEYDLKVFVTQLVDLGSEKFLKRYGRSPLVAEKYEILYEFITKELGVEL